MASKNELFCLFGGKELHDTVIFEMKLKPNNLYPIDLDLLTADQVANILGTKRNTVMQTKGRIGFSKPYKTVYFRFDDVAMYALKTAYHPPADLVMNEEDRDASIREFIQGLRRRLEAA